ncbi:hypothetical protein [Actinospica sp.]|uniref:hypothetical protein n=1 Tax=Actinospica sp. TaxID=1872142 RepID=UPI002C9BC151|nr:hypothetical protein [Actinospica sp.]HWG25140.1 hypothetical protein [Actinospica sp.]
MDDADRYLNVVDVEATCRPGRPPAGMVDEIIGVGLTVVDLQEGRRIGKHGILAPPANESRPKPAANPKTPSNPHPHWRAG